MVILCNCKYNYIHGCWTVIRCGEEYVERRHFSRNGTNNNIVVPSELMVRCIAPDIPPIWTASCSKETYSPALWDSTP